MRRCSLVLLVALATLAVLLGEAWVLPASRSSAQEPTVRRSYVALGDSYASGVGTRAYLDDGSGCRRSVYSYPYRLARARGWRLSFRACAGATVASVRRHQLASMVSARFVSISVGGNDAGFSRVLRECAQPAWASDCGRYVDDARAVIRTHLPGRLAALFRTLRSRAPRAVVAVVGYPRIFMGEDCNPGTWFSPTEQRRLNATADLLDDVLRAAARARGFRFADPRAGFASHAVCHRTEWINGLSRPVVESFHPNRSGHGSGYLPLVGRVLVGGG